MSQVLKAPAVRAAVVVCALALGWAAVSAFAAVAVAEQASQPGFSAAGGVDAGAHHTCALVGGGSVRCWGFGGTGELGYGNTSTVGDDETPGQAGPVSLGLGRATAIGVGDFHTCALVDDGGVRCWGFGEEGRLGYGNRSTVGDDEAPGQVGSVSLGGRATAISGGGGHTCALLEGGGVRCWGFGALGELGYGSGDNVGGRPETTPDKAGSVKLGRPAVAVSAGRLHTCALLDDGSVRCWGDNSRGQLGYDNTTTIGDDEAPDSAYALNAVACPAVTQCTAVDAIGRQVTFDPTAPGAPTPTTIDNGQALTGVACPSTRQCTAVDAIGRQVTFDPTAPGAPTPTTVGRQGLAGVACPSASQCTAVGLSQQVTFNPTAPGTTTPTTIGREGLSGVACPAITQCTAVDFLGREVTFNPTAPGIPTPTTIDSGNQLNAVACPAVTKCTAVDDAGREVTFDPAAPGTPTPTTIDDGKQLYAVACPSVTQCTAVGSSQQVTFDPTAPGTPTPTTIDDDSRLNGVACPSVTQCTAVDSPFGREVTFNPTAPGAPIPTTVARIPPVNLGPRRATAIAAGDFHTCALLDDGSVRCWGSGASGKLGYGNTNNVGGAPGNTPDKAGAVSLGGRAVAISAGGNHTCAVLDGGSVRCWGSGANGRLGYGSSENVGDDESPGSVGPVYLGAERRAVAISAGGAHACARLDDGSVRCWGDAGNGLLGYCNTNDIGDDETPGSVGPIALETSASPCAPPDGGAGPAGGPGPLPGSPPVPSAPAIPVGSSVGRGDSIDPLAREAQRARGLRSCLVAARRRTKGKPRRQSEKARRSCMKRYGRTPGRVKGLRARAASKTKIVLSFTAPGSDGPRPPAARAYLVKQSRRPIRDKRGFARAQSLCRGTCRFKVTRVWTKLKLTVTDLRPSTTYYYALAARDNVSQRLGPRSPAAKAKTRQR